MTEVIASIAMPMFAYAGVMQVRERSRLEAAANFAVAAASAKAISTRRDRDPRTHDLVACVAPAALGAVCCVTAFRVGAGRGVHDCGCFGSASSTNLEQLRRNCALVLLAATIAQVAPTADPGHLRIAGCFVGSIAVVLSRRWSRHV